MKIITDVIHIRKFRKPVVALGVFDGVHLAHRHILQEAVTRARRIKGTSIVVTFWPHPQKQESLYSLEHRLRLIEELKVDVVVVIRFTEHFARLSAQDFVEDILVGKLGAAHILIGRNFRFGNRAQGDFALLGSLAKKNHFQLKVFNVVTNKGKPISSTYIRRLITGGDLLAARQLLGRPVSVYGTVVKGASLGKKLGFPTANINPHHEILPQSGIYAVGVALGKKYLNGACYIGTRPTFRARKAGAKTIEVHIFDFNKNLYGKNIDIQFIKKIREDKRFSSVSALVAQIKKDIIRVKSGL